MSVSARSYRSADLVMRRSLGVRRLPLLELLGEVQEPDLLELGRRVERGALADAGVLGDRREDRVALLLRPPVGHREDRVRPVLVGGALVAVRDAAERRHAAPDLADALLRDLPDAHAVGAEAGAAMEEDRGDAPQDPALLHALEVLD